MEPHDVRSLRGLEPDEAARRLAADGPNELPTERRHTFFEAVVRTVTEPMILLLIAGAALYFVIGDIQEALTLVGAVFVVVAISVVQERKSERALDALRDLTSPRALVIRGGREQRIAGREVVRGDLVVLAEGDRVPADGVLVDALSVQVDESLLTGESVPVRKIAAPSGAPGGATPARPGGDDHPFVYSGTLVVRGRGVAEVLATGAHTEIGHIGRVLASVEIGRTRLQQQVDAIVRVVAILAVALCAVLVVVYGLTRSDWLGGLLAGITLAMALLPEEFPVVLTVFLALGAWRLSRVRVLTRHVPALEALGGATVLCVDKTGTLTQNRMRVARLWNCHREVDLEGTLPDELDEDVHELVEHGILASQRDPFDPMEVAFHELGDRALRGTEHLHHEWTLDREYPLSPDLLAMSHVWSAPDGTRIVVAAKGAPEAIVELCHCDAATRSRVLERASAMASGGLRVLGVARATRSHAREPVEQALPPDQHAFDFELLGLVGLADPVRPGVPAAIAECREAGVRVVMITGDYAETARAIAARIGLDPGDAIVTGPELAEMSDDELRERIAGVRIFARVVPEQKLRIVQALADRGEVVAMTGDGVNDAPALRAARIGIAMGGRGTDVAREAAALVVTDDDFSSIVAGVRLGRRIYDNLRKSMAYIVAVHVPIAGVSLAPVLAGWPLVLLPAHVAFLELIIDPACSVAFEAEPEEKDVMRRPPRSQSERLFGARLLGVALLQGAGVLVVELALLAWTLGAGEPVAHARAIVFAALITANLSLILVNRSWTRVVLATLGEKNRALYAVVLGALAFLLVALYVPPVASLFAVDPLPIDHLLIAMGAGALSVGWFEILKAAKPRFMEPKGERKRERAPQSVQTTLPP